MVDVSTAGWLTPVNGRMVCAITDCMSMSSGFPQSWALVRRPLGAAAEDLFTGVCAKQFETITVAKAVALTAINARPNLK